MRFTGGLQKYQYPYQQRWAIFKLEVFKIRIANTSSIFLFNHVLGNIFDGCISILRSGNSSTIQCNINTTAFTYNLDAPLGDENYDM